jgi:hypothetical protein
MRACGFFGYWRFTSRMAMQKAAAGISPPGSLEKIQRHRVDSTSPTVSSGTDRSASRGGYGALTERSMAGRIQETTASLYLNKCGWRRIASARSSIVANACRFKRTRGARRARPSQFRSILLLRHHSSCRRDSATRRHGRNRKRQPSIPSRRPVSRIEFAISFQVQISLHITDRE